MKNIVPYRLFLLVGVLSISIISLHTFIMLPAVVFSNQQHSAFATVADTSPPVISSFDANPKVLGPNDVTPEHGNPRVTVEAQVSDNVGATVVAVFVYPKGSTDLVGQAGAQLALVEGNAQNGKWRGTYSFWPSNAPDGEYELYVWARDAANNEVTAGPIIITIDRIPQSDITPPVITVPSEGITAEATGPDGAMVSFEDQVSAQDDVDGAVDVTCDYSSGDTFPIGQTTVTCSAQDTAGNSAVETFTVTVQDTTAPTLQLPSSDDVTVEATSASGASVTYTAIATDAVDGSQVQVICTPESGSTFALGQTTVNCEAQDSADNIASGSFTVTVQDTTAPDVEITEAVDRRNREVADGDTTPTPYIRITFETTDAVGVESTECSLDGQQPFTSCGSLVVYDRLSRGTHEFTVRATDDAGNVGEDEFTWTVGANPPAIPPGRQ